MHFGLDTVLSVGYGMTMLLVKLLSRGYNKLVRLVINRGHMHNWQLQEAKARFSELVKLAASEGPQHITVHGEPAVVVLSAKDYNKLKKPKSSFVEFLNRSPLKGITLELKRNKSGTRDIDL